MRFTTAEICAATNGDQFGRACEVEGVTIDSRQIDVGPAATAPLISA